MPCLVPSCCNGMQDLFVVDFFAYPYCGAHPDRGFPKHNKVS